MPKHRWEADGDDETSRQDKAPCSEASHSWDTPDAALSAPMPPVPAAFSDDEDMEEVDPAHSPEEAADTFAQVLLEHYYDSSLSAKAVCTLAYYASVAGMPGLLQELAVKPQSSSTNRSHIDQTSEAGPTTCATRQQPSRKSCTHSTPSSRNDKLQLHT